MLPSAPQEPAIVAGFYEAAARRQGWSDAWSALCTAFDAETGLLFRRSRPAAQPIILAACNWPRETHGLKQDTVPGIDAAWLDAGKCRAISAPTDTLCATASLEGTAVIGLGLHRPKAPLFTETDRNTLDGIGLHVAAALRLEALLAAERVVSGVRGAALDTSPHGVMVLDADGAILFANAAARRIAASHGLPFGRWAGGPARLPTQQADRLADLVTGAGTGGPGGCMRLERPGQAPIAAVIEPLPEDIAAQNSLPAGAYVIATLRDLGATADAAPSHLMDLFHLTAAEAAIVPQLLCGESAALIAKSRGVGVDTVKAQSARVLAKTGAPNLRALSLMIAALGCG